MTYNPRIGDTNEPVVCTMIEMVNVKIFGKPVRQIGYVIDYVFTKMCDYCCEHDSWWNLRIFYRMNNLKETMLIVSLT